jgi:hypothetical protein
MKTTLYEANVASLGDAVRKGVAMLGEAQAEVMDAWEALDHQAAFPANTTEVFVSLRRGGARCPVAMRLVLTVQLRPVEEMDRRVAEGGR